jgi:hypothetical protein
MKSENEMLKISRSSENIGSNSGGAKEKGKTG